MMTEEWETLVGRVIEKEENKSYRLYKCPANKLTIGIGYNIEDNGIDEEVIQLLFKKSLATAIDTARRIFGDQFFTSLGQGRKLGIINMIFQLGETRFRKFVNTTAAIKLQDWPNVEAHLLRSAWAKQTPARAKRVISMIVYDKIPQYYY